MSVFQLQSWWDVQTCQSEEFDFGCLVVGNVDNASPAADKVVIGSQQGMLRVYNPTRPQYRVEDLILEESLSLPILQLQLGQFIPSTENLGLAILHPKKLAVFELNAQSNKDGKSVNYYALRKCYEHNLGLEGKHFTAYNMIVGPFGGVKGRDMFMVQSLDGKLQIFEQSANAFTRQLVDCLIPFPIAYLPRLDAFVAASYACQIECYRYQVLASSQTEIGTTEKPQSSKANKASGLTTGAFGLTALRSALVEWTINLGENCRQIVDGNFSETEPSNRGTGEILVLCDQSLFLLKASGGIIQQKKLEKEPSCVVAYKSPSSRHKHNFLLANRDCTVQVFSGFGLLWASKLTSVPVHMAVANFGLQRGLIVTIDEDGHLTAGYLGTKPPVSSVVSHARELDYDKVDEEHKSLLKIIRESQLENKSEPKDKLVIRTQLSRTLDTEPLVVEAPIDCVPLISSLSGISGDVKLVKICVRVYVSFTGSKATTDVSLVVSTPSFVNAVPRTIVLQKVSGVQTTPTMVKVYFFASKSVLPVGLQAQIVANYLSPNGEPRVAVHPITLPLHLACRPRAALKTGIHKITLDTDAAAQPLTDIFDDYLYAYQDVGVDIADTLGNSASQAMGFQFWCNSFFDPNNGSGHSAEVGKLQNGSGVGYQQPAVVSILVSKTAGRYRVQSDSLPAMLTVLTELESRLNERISQLKDVLLDTNKKPSAPNRGDEAATESVLSCADALPLDDFFGVITVHFFMRQQMHEFMSQLNDCAHQFRMIEKRLLVRFKDRNPTPLGGLDIVMKETYRRILQLGDSVQDCQNKILKVSVDLDCIARIVVLVTSLRFDLSSTERRRLGSYFCPGFIDTPDQGWEETVDISLTYLLKTSLAKSAKDTTTLTNSSIEMPNDIEPLKKHITMVLDRISKGGKKALSTSSTTVQ